MADKVATRKREDWLDIAKAILMVGVSFRHSGVPIYFLPTIVVTSFIAISGYGFRERKFIDFIKKQFLGMWVPFVVANTIVMLFHNVWVNMGIWDGAPYDMPTKLQLIIRSCKFYASDALGAADWFVFMIFICNLSFFFLYYLAKLIFRQYLDIALAVISAIMFIVGIVYNAQLNTIIWANNAFLTNVFMCMSVYYIGYIARKYSLIAKIMQLNKKLLFGIYVVVVGILCYGYSVLGYLADNRTGLFTVPWMLPIMTVSALIWMLLTSKAIIEKIPVIRELAEYAGQSSLYIMLYHGLAFQIVTIIQVKMLHMEYDPAWQWPNFYMGSGFWVLLAGCLGIVVPMIIRWVWMYFKGLIFKKFVVKKNA